MHHALAFRLATIVVDPMGAQVMVVRHPDRAGRTRARSPDSIGVFKDHGIKPIKRRCQRDGQSRHATAQHYDVDLPLRSAVGEMTHRELMFLSFSASRTCSGSHRVTAIAIL